MATSPTKPEADEAAHLEGLGVPGWPRGKGGSQPLGAVPGGSPDAPQPFHQDAFQALLAFSALHGQVRRRRALAAQHTGFDGGVPEPGHSGSGVPAEFDLEELFVLDEVLQLVAERAVAITGADGLAIALAENNEIVLRASAGEIKPDRGTRIDRDSAFSGACFREAQIVICDDTETDTRVNLQACRKMGARS